MLPNVDVTTIIWADEICESCDWNVAQGDDLKNCRSTIELNFLKLVDNSDDIEKIAESLIKNWLSIYLVLSVRQDLINHNIRGLINSEEELELCRGIINKVITNLGKFDDLVQKAKKALMESTKVSSPGLQEILENVIRVLKS
ncbi:unnamed protein product [marine sediment metagenome]|uniref:Uncharacterized protein n=1 Tax=marine sediment metagenome TaxID=412755 RepID=X1NKL9_9ZZZZ